MTGGGAARRSFASGAALNDLAARLAATVAPQRKTLALRRRAEAIKAREDKRAWVMQRRERTRHLIELGGRS